MPEIKAIILDYDGVIVDSLKPLMEISNSLAAKYKYSQTKDKDEFVKVFDRNLFDPVQSLKLTGLRAPIYLKDLKKKLKDANKKIKVIPGIGQLVSVLSEHFKLAIVSNNFKDIINETLAKEKIKDKFEAIVSGEEGSNKSKLIKICLEKLKLNPNEAVFICDTYVDVMFGKDARVKIIAVTWGYQLRPRLLTASPDFIVEKPSELLEALNVLIQE